MAIDTLMQYLEDSKRKMNIQFEQDFINNVTISHHEIHNNMLYVYTHEGFKVNINVLAFKRICFDSIIFDATNKEEMKLCLEYLRSFKNFNIFLQDKHCNYILYLYLIDN